MLKSSSLSFRTQWNFQSSQIGKISSKNSTPTFWRQRNTMQHSRRRVSKCFHRISKIAWLLRNNLCYFTQGWMDSPTSSSRAHWKVTYLFQRIVNGSELSSRSNCVQVWNSMSQTILTLHKIEIYPELGTVNQQLQNSNLISLIA